MIMRLFLGVGLVLLAVTSYFVVVVPPPNVQLVPKVSAVTVLQREGILPTGDIAENEEIEHGIFEVPPQDEVMLESATADMDMSGMDMGGSTMTMPNGTVMNDSDMPAAGDTAMDMSNGEGTMTMPNGTVMNDSDMPAAGDTAMDMSNGEGTMTMPDGTVMKESDMPAAGDTAMDMSNGEGTMTMPDGTVMKDSDMPAAGDTAMDMSNGEGTMTMPDGTVMKDSDMPAAGDTAMDMNKGNETMTTADDTAMDGMDTAEMEMAEGGLAFSDDGDFDREITLSMTEWTFSDLNLEVAKGERIRFTVRNDGQTLHEFMFMTMPAMAAVNYRAKRADWNLLEHEALFEKSLLLPGGEISFIVEVQQTGNWMFMCMLPYHMQMGMMGQMATPGSAMNM
tara:strand:+ start:2350 stop:3528 length:1179 start_codon:yes stop_codon:yes gene_type:complete